MSDPEQETVANELIKTACFKCRGNRHGCDRKQPICSRCERRGFTCIYPEATPTLKKLQSDTIMLTNRVKAFQSRLKSLRTDRHCPVVTDSIRNMSIYPCDKCNRELQQCDLKLPKCGRCLENGYKCRFVKTEPKVVHVSEMIRRMNGLLDSWQDAMNAQANVPPAPKRKMKARSRFAWTVMSGQQGLQICCQVTSYQELSLLLDYFNALSIRSTDTGERPFKLESLLESPSFAVWQAWSNPTHTMPTNYPVDISEELTDTLVELFCQTPCCSSVRIPIIDTQEFLTRYRHPDATQRPSQVLVYAICAMAARNAFQLHVWNKRPAHESPKYSMGKALSVAYCLRGRELLAECFDEPSMDACHAAIILSYCSYQNGYPGVIYIYEWITFTMANELGLYDKNRTLSTRESYLVWTVYYFNTWSRVLRGGTSDPLGFTQYFPRNSMPRVPPQPPPHAPHAAMADYYVLSMWSYAIQLQVQRDDLVSRIVSVREKEQSDAKLAHDLKVMQSELDDFIQSLPEEWKQPASVNPGETTSTVRCGDLDHINMEGLAHSCIIHVQIEYNINRILLHYPFLPSDHAPQSPYVQHCLQVCLDAAQSITCALEAMISQCSMPLVGFLFSSFVYQKLLHYAEYKDIARQRLHHLVTIAKASASYAYDFELAKTLVQLLERNAQPVSAQEPR